jgi:hypothetical protein
MKTVIQRVAFFMVSIFLDGVTSRDESKRARPRSTAAIRVTNALLQRRFATIRVFDESSTSAATDRIAFRRANRDE